MPSSFSLFLQRSLYKALNFGLDNSTAGSTGGSIVVVVGMVLLQAKRVVIEYISSHLKWTWHIAAPALRHRPFHKHSQPTTRSKREFRFQYSTYDAPDRGVSDVPQTHDRPLPARILHHQATHLWCLYARATSSATMKDRIVSN